MPQYHITLNSEADTQALAHLLGQQCSTGVVFLQGDLGAGKTTFVRYWLRALGITGAIKSPTYTLVEPYQTAKKPVYHFDLYRLHAPEELDLLGFQDYVADAGALILIEWPCKAGYLQPTPSICLDINMSAHTQDDVRTVTIDSSIALVLPIGLQ